MAALAQVPGVEDLVREKILKERKSYMMVSHELQQLYPGLRGLSPRSVRRYCQEKAIYPTSRLSDAQLDAVITISVAQVCLISRSVPLSCPVNAIN